MALADLNNVKKRVIRILNANESAWAATVSGNIGAFPDDSEITAAILEADQKICNEGYFPSVNETLRRDFMTWSGILGNRAKLPFFHGKRGKVEVAATAQTKTFVDANVTVGTDTIAITAHGLVTGQIVSLISSGALPAGLSNSAEYYVIATDANNIKLANSIQNAVIGTAVDITAAAGGGTHTVIAWVSATESKNIGSMMKAITNGAYSNTSAFDHLYCIENGVFFHPAVYGRVEFPLYTRTAALQCQESEETLIIATAIRLLTKHASPATFDTWAKESIAGINQLKTEGIYQEGV